MRQHSPTFRARTLGRVLGSALRIGALGGLIINGAGCLHGTAPALRVEATPDMFSLPSTDGMLDSPAALMQGPLVLIFYRGHW